MTLPQETIDKIIKRSKEYAGDKNDTSSVSARIAYQRGATEWVGKAGDDAFIRGYACCVTCIIKGHGISTEVEEAFKAGIGSLQRCIDANCDEYDIEILKKYFK